LRARLRGHDVLGGLHGRRDGRVEIGTRGRRTDALGDDDCIADECGCRRHERYFVDDHRRGGMLGVERVDGHQGAEWVGDGGADSRDDELSAHVPG